VGGDKNGEKYCLMRATKKMKTVLRVSIFDGRKMMSLSSLSTRFQLQLSYCFFLVLFQHYLFSAKYLASKYRILLLHSINSNDISINLNYMDILV
jgi:hypothetical protein